METTTTDRPKQILRNRFSKKMVEKRKVPGVEVTARDKAMFAIIANDDTKFAALDYLFALLDGHGKDYQSFSKHVTRLFLNGYIAYPFGQTKTKRADSNFRIIELTEKGRDELRKVSTNVPAFRRTQLFEHKNLGCVFNLSAMLAERERPGLRVIKWHEVMANDRFPEKTRELKRPEVVQVTHDQIIIPDAQFMLSYDSERFRFCVREDDCDTESGWSDFQNTIKFKVWAYLTILQNEIYTDHYGTSTFFALFHTVNTGRAKEILKIIEMVVLEFGFEPELAETLLVKCTPMFNTLEGSPAPATGHVLTEPWQRAFDFGDLQLDTP